MDYELLQLIMLQVCTAVLVRFHPIRDVEIREVDRILPPFGLAAAIIKVIGALPIGATENLPPLSGGPAHLLQ